MQENREFPSLIRKIVGQREEPVRVRIADYGTVFIVDDSVVIQVPETDITRSGSRLGSVAVYLIPVLEKPVSHISIEYINRITGSEHSHVGVAHLIDKHRGLTVQVQNFVLVIGSRQSRFPREKTFHIDGTQGHFHSLITHLAGISEGFGSIFKAGSDRNGSFHQHIGCLLDICIQRKVDT